MSLSEDDEADHSQSNTASGVYNDDKVMIGLQTGRKFHSFEEVKTLVDTLKAANHPMRVFNSQSIGDYNKRRLQAKEPLEPNDKKWQYAYYVIGCVHFGQPRRMSTGVRCKQRHLALGCNTNPMIEN